jgi:hypothetical protein
MQGLTPYSWRSTINNVPDRDFWSIAMTADDPLWSRSATELAARVRTGAVGVQLVDGRHREDVLLERDPLWWITLQPCSQRLIHRFGDSASADQALAAGAAIEASGIPPAPIDPA